MSVVPTEEPLCIEPEGGSIELVITGRARDLGGFTVSRVLPAMKRRAVGPFVFFDHMTRHELAPGHGMERAAASAHRPGDGHLSVRRRDRPQGQPRLEQAIAPGT